MSNVLLNDSPTATALDEIRMTQSDSDSPDNDKLTNNKIDNNTYREDSDSEEREASQMVDTSFEDQEVNVIVRDIVNYVGSNYNTERAMARILDHIFKKSKNKLQLHKMQSGMKNARPLGFKSGRIYANIYNHTRKVHGKTYTKINSSKSTKKRHVDVQLISDSESEKQEDTDDEKLIRPIRSQSAHNRPDPPKKQDTEEKPSTSKSPMNIQLTKKRKTASSEDEDEPQASTKKIPQLKLVRCDMTKKKHKEIPDRNIFVNLKKWFIDSDTENNKQEPGDEQHTEMGDSEDEAINPSSVDDSDDDLTYEPTAEEDRERREQIILTEKTLKAKPKKRNVKMKWLKASQPRSSGKTVSNRIEAEGLNQLFPIDGLHLKNLMEATAAESTRMPGTNFPKEMTQTVSKDLSWATAAEKKYHLDLNHLVNTQKINDWLSIYQKCGMSGSGLYNKLDYISRSVTYFVSMNQITKPPHFEDFVKRKLKVFNKLRKIRAMEKREDVIDQGVIDPKEVYSKIICNENLKEQFNSIVETCKSSKNKLPCRKFLFGMRLALANIFVGVCSRPCGLYSLSYKAASEPHVGHWNGPGEVILKKQTS